MIEKSTVKNLEYPKNARLIALQALLRVDAENAYSNIVLDTALRKTELDARDSAFASALFYGVLERRITLDYIILSYSRMPLKKISAAVLEILRMGLYQLIYMDKVPQPAAVNESVKLAKLYRQNSASGFINGILRSFIRSGCKVKLPDEKEDSAHFLSIKYSCPEWIIDLWLASYSRDCTMGLLKSLAGRPPLTARVNTLRNFQKNLIEKLAVQGVKAIDVTDVENAIELENTGSIEKISSFISGELHIQDLASQICCAALQVKPGMRVIDVCSAPGGKAFTLAQMMNNTGELLAFDCYDAKVRLIRQGAERLGLSIIRADVRDAQAPAQPLPPADRVLCDVPCSGLGIIRRKPEIRYKKDDTLDSLPNLQYRILCESSKLVKAGGILLYSTCTLNPFENNRIADRFLLENSDFGPEPVRLPAGFEKNAGEPANQVTLMPHIHGTDGFFISVFRRLR